MNVTLSRKRDLQELKPSWTVQWVLSEITRVLINGGQEGQAEKDVRVLEAEVMP